MPTTTAQTHNSLRGSTASTGLDHLSVGLSDQNAHAQTGAPNLGENALVGQFQKSFTEAPPGGGDGSKSGLSFKPMNAYGDHQKELTLTRGQDVLEQSNNKTNDALWAHTNGGSEQLSVEKGAKPEEWLEGIRLEEIDGTLVPIMKGDESVEKRLAAAKKLGFKKLKDYRKRIVQDFNFSGATRHFDPSFDPAKDDFDVDSDVHFQAGKAKFLSAAVSRYGPTTRGADRERIKRLATEIWSYATRGCDTKGATNIGQMQGLLHALDSQIASVSDTNTKRTGTSAEVGTDGVSVEALDGTHGRATILTTRMLMGAIEDGDSVNIGTPFDGFFATYILTDISGSMRSEIQEFAKLIMFGRGGDRFEISTFHDDERTLQTAMVDSPPADAVSRYSALKKKVLALWKQTQRLSLSQSDMKAVKKEYKTRASELNRYAIQMFRFNSAEAYAELDNAGTTNRDPAFNKVNGSDGKPLGMEESGILNAIERLKLIPPHQDQSSKYRSQMIILTDETDSLMAYESSSGAKTAKVKLAWDKIQLLQGMAEERIIKVKIVFSLQQHDAAEDYRILRLEDITYSDVFTIMKTSKSNWGTLAAQKEASNYGRSGDQQGKPDGYYRKRNW